MTEATTPEPPYDWSAMVLFSCCGSVVYRAALSLYAHVTAYVLGQSTSSPSSEPSCGSLRLRVAFFWDGCALASQVGTVRLLTSTPRSASEAQHRVTLSEMEAQRASEAAADGR